MKKKLISLAVAGVLLAQIPLHAGEPAAVPSIPPFFQTLIGASQELHGLGDKQGNVAQSLERYSQFEFSPSVRAQLKEIFGSEHPLEVKRAPAAKGLIGYTLALPEHTYLDKSGTALSWSALTGKISTNKGGTLLNTDVQWPSLSLNANGGGVVLRDISLTSRQARGTEALWYGTTAVKLGAISFRSAAPGTGQTKEQVRLEGLEFKGEAQRKGALMSSNFDTGIRAVTAANGVSVERIHIGMRLLDVPVQQMADFDQTMRNVQASGLAPEAQHTVILRALSGFGKNLVKSGASLAIDDISGAYHGYTASLKGRVSFDKVVDADFDNSVAVLKKMVLHLDLRVPVALVNDVMKGISPNDSNAAKNLIAKITGDGFAVQEQGDLHAAIDVRDGKLTFNGKVIAIPGVKDGNIDDIHFNVRPGPVRAQ